MGIDKGGRTLAWSLTLSSVELFFAVVKDRVVKGTSYLPVELPGIVMDSGHAHWEAFAYQRLSPPLRVSMCVMATPGSTVLTFLSTFLPAS